MTSSDVKSTLNEDTTWRISFLCNGIPTENGNIVDQIFVINVQFIEEMGYEPPQGEMLQTTVKTTYDGAGEKISNNSFKISKATWKLSEDPNDRKDGLWIWGLFAEPLYPFMLLQIETEAYELPNNNLIRPLKLYAQLTHTRDKEKGVTLIGGVLNIREKETYKLDPFGASSIDLFEDKAIGQLNIQPLTSLSVK